MAQDSDIRKDEKIIKSVNEVQKPGVPNWLIENIAEVSRNAQRIYFLYFGSLTYCALTIVSTSDRQIILNEKARLPIINLDVSLNGFFILSPVILLLFFAYFQLYLHRLKGLKTDLRGKYASLEKRQLYPWMLNIAEDPEPGIIGKLQTMTLKFTLWTSLPIVLNLNAFWYLKKHEPIWSYVIGGISVFGTIIVLWFWYQYDPNQWRKTVRWFIINVIAISIVFLFEVFLLFKLIPWGREGGKYEWLRPYICVDLSYQKLITEPEKDYGGFCWGNFEKAHLEGAELINTILKRSNLREANLKNADLKYSILEEADLNKANLQGASFRGANLRGANLWIADLERANLSGANLQGANLKGANLKGTNLQGADLRGAELHSANLDGADLTNANLQKASLSIANLQGGNLWGANLEGAFLSGANLYGVDLRSAKLSPSQLFKVDTLYSAKLDDRIVKEVRRKHGNLLVKPKVK